MSLPARSFEIDRSANRTTVALLIAAGVEPASTEDLAPAGRSIAC